MSDGVLVGPGWGIQVYVWAGLVPHLRLQNGALAGQWGDGSGVCLTPEHFGCQSQALQTLPVKTGIVPQEEKAPSWRA